MVYQGTPRPRKWRVLLQNCSKVVGYTFLTLLGVFLCMSENWVALGVPILILTLYKILQTSEHTTGRCPYCGAHIATKAGWAVVCRTCNQRSYVRYGQMLENMVTKHI